MMKFNILNLIMKFSSMNFMNLIMLSLLSRKRMQIELLFVYFDFYPNKISVVLIIFDDGKIILLSKIF